MSTTRTASTPRPVLDPPSDHPSSRRRRLAFRVALAATTLVLLPLLVIGMAELVLAWLPEETVRAITDDPALTPGVYDAHRIHHLATGLLAIAYASTLLVQLRRPGRRAASITLLLATAVYGSLLYAISGPFTDWVVEELVLLVPVATLAALHPRRLELLRPLHVRGPMGVLAAAAAVPWTLYAASAAARQATHAPGDIHGSVEHWATMALVGLTIATAAVLGASTRDGWRVPAGVAAAISVLLGANSLAYPGAASALATPVALASITWGLVFAVVAIRRTDDDARRRADLA